MKRRLARKRLRPLERMLDNACRLYLTRPSAGRLNDSYEPLARSLVQLQLSFLLWEHAQLGVIGFRGYRVDEVTLGTLEASTNGVHGVGTVLLERSVGGAKETRSEPFRFRCVVPSRRKTYRGAPRPEVSWLMGARTA